jgi:hypothetical protein
MRKGKLEISFYGPFVCIVGTKATTIYAPRCSGHYGSIFSTEDEASLDHDRESGMKKVYEVRSGILPSKTAISSVGGAEYLSPPKTHQLCRKDPSRAWFCLKVPNPAVMVAIRQDKDSQAIITGTGAPKGKHTWATGLRLVFDYDMDKPDFALVIAGAAAFETNLIDYSSADQKLSTHFDLTVRLAGPFLFDPDHDDAMDCFAASARLFQHKRNAKDLDWKLNYPHTDVRPGSDCGSPPFVSI